MGKKVTFTGISTGFINFDTDAEYDAWNTTQQNYSYQAASKPVTWETETWGHTVEDT